MNFFDPDIFSNRELTNRKISFLQGVPLECTVDCEKDDKEGGVIHGYINIINVVLNSLVKGTYPSECFTQSLNGIFLMLRQFFRLKLDIEQQKLKIDDSYLENNRLLFLDGKVINKFIDENKEYAENLLQEIINDFNYYSISPPTSLYEVSVKLTNFFDFYDKKIRKNIEYLSKLIPQHIKLKSLPSLWSSIIDFKCATTTANNFNFDAVLYNDKHPTMDDIGDIFNAAKVDEYIPAIVFVSSDINKKVIKLFDNTEIINYENVKIVIDEGISKPNSIEIIFWVDEIKPSVSSTRNSYSKISIVFEKNTVYFYTRVPNINIITPVFSKIKENTGLVLHEREWSSISGSFMIFLEKDEETRNLDFIHPDNFDDLSISHAILHDELVKNYIYTEESSRTAFTGKTFHITIRSDQDDCVDEADEQGNYGTVSFTKLKSLGEKIIGYKDNVENLQIIDVPPGANILLCNFSRVPDFPTAYYVQYLLKKLIVRLMEKNQEYLQLYSNIFNTTRVVSGIKNNIKEIGGERNKLQELQDAAPEVFVTSYARDICQHNKQPVLIPEKDIEKWKQEHTYEENKIIRNRDVMSFEVVERNKTIFLGCEGKNEPFIGLKKNTTLSNREQYPYLPCCYSTRKKAMSDNLFISDNRFIQFLRQGNYRISTNKILTPGRVAKLTPLLNNILNVNEYERYTVHISPSSLLLCVLTALFPDTFSLLNPEWYNYETIQPQVNEYRNKLAEFLSERIWIVRQEMPTKSPEDIVEYLRNPENYIDSKLYYRVLEEYFDINIFVFYYENNNVEIEIPNFQYFHSRYENLQRSSIAIFKHWGSESDSILTHPHYELIKPIDKKTNSYFVKPEITQKLYETIKLTQTYLFFNYDKTTNQIINSVNNFNIVNTFIRENESNIISQLIDLNGKLRAVNVKINENLFTIFTIPTQPLNVQQSNDIIYSSLKNVLCTFGTPSAISLSDNYLIGLWYGNDPYFYISIEKSEIPPILSSYPQKFPLVLEENGIDNIARYRKMKKQIQIILIIIENAFIISKVEDPEKFMNQYTEYETEEVKDSSTFYNFEQISRFFPLTKDFRIAMKTYKNTGLYDEKTNKIVLYSEDFAYKIYYHLKQFYKRNGYKKDLEPTRQLYNLNSLNEFMIQPQTILFYEQASFKSWINQNLLIKSEKILTTLNYFLSENENPYIYRDTNNRIFIVQNVKGDDFRRPLIIAKLWNEEKINYQNKIFVKKYLNILDEPYVIYNISVNSDLIVSVDKTMGKSSYLEIIQYQNGRFAALLPLNTESDEKINEFSIKNE